MDSSFQQASAVAVQEGGSHVQTKRIAFSFLDSGVSKAQHFESEVGGTRLPSFLPQEHDRSLTAHSPNVNSCAPLLFAHNSKPNTDSSNNNTTTATEQTSTFATTSSPSSMAPTDIDINSLPPHKRTKYKKELAAAQAAEDAEHKKQQENSAPTSQTPAVDDVAHQEIRQKLEADFNVTVYEPVKGQLVPYSTSSPESSDGARRRTFPPPDFVLAKREKANEVRIADQPGFLSPDRDSRRESGTNNAHSEWMRPPMNKRKSSRRSGGSPWAQNDWRAREQESAPSSALASIGHPVQIARHPDMGSTQTAGGVLGPFSAGSFAGQRGSSGSKSAREQAVANPDQKQLSLSRSWLDRTREALVKAGNTNFPRPPPPDPHPVAYSTSPPDSLNNSDRASSGWGTRQKRAKEQAWFHAEKNENDLRDWDGGMAPPPVDWDNRPGFKDEYSREKIHEWNIDVSKNLLGVKHADMMATVGDLTFDIQGEAAPRYWIPIGKHVGFADKIWLEATTSKLSPIDEGDLDNAKPWWKYYENAQCSFLTQKAGPQISGIDPDETETDRLARENDKGGIHVVENKQNAAKAKKDAHRARQLKKQERIRQLSQTISTQVEKPSPIRPTLPRFFIRSATIHDMPAVKDLYNHFVDHAVLVPETSRLQTTDLELHFRASKDADLPFLLACQRGERIKARGKKNQRYMDGHDLVLPDKVVGYACADDWNDMRGMCCYTACLELYVDPDCQGKGVGSALLDRIMSMLDPRYLERGGYETVGEDIDGVGPVRLIKNVIVQYYYDGANRDKLGWVSQWLERWLGFKKTGDLDGIGWKFDKSVNLAFLQKTTGAKLD